MDADCPICHQQKITSSVLAPGGACETKNSATVGRNNVQTSYNNNTLAPINLTVSQSAFDRKYLICETYLIDSRSKSLLQQRLKIHLPLPVNELLYALGTLLYLDFFFYDIESVRGYKSELDVNCL